MGVVYLAWDPRLERELALKVLAPTANPERFRREAEAMGKVSHPNVVRVHASGVDPRGCPWLAMELVRGRTLSERIDEERTLSVAEATRLARELGEALVEVHRQGLVHRDVKPANVLLRDGRALLADFGLAREDEAERLTRTGQILGTPGYAAPELLLGPGAARAGPPADVYGLGATLYAMLTGAPPVGGATLQEVLVATASTPPAAPHALNPSVPLPLSRLCLRCLEKDPDQRATLSELLEGLALPKAEEHQRRLGPVLLGVAALLATGALAWVLLVNSRTQPQPSPQVALSLKPSSSHARHEAPDDDLVAALLAIERRFLVKDRAGARRIQARFEAAAPGTLGALLLDERLRFQRSSRTKRKSFVSSIAPLASADSTGLGHYLLGRSYYARRYYHRSSAAFGHAIALRPEPLYRLHRIRAAVFTKEFELIEEDIRVLDAGVEPWLAPERDSVIARYLLRVARYAEGRARVRKLIADHGSTPARLGLLGRLLGAEGVSLIEARRVLDLSLAGRPTDQSLWGARIRLPVIARDVQDARQVSDRALKALGEIPYSQDSVLVLARLWVELLEGGDRRAIAKRVRACKAKGPRALIFKARLMVELGNLGLAKSLLAHVIESAVPRFDREAKRLLARVERVTPGAVPRAQPR